MTDSEFFELMEWAGKLWTTWRPTEQQVEQWKGLLMPFDYSIAKRAFEAVWQSKTYGKPAPDAVLTQCRLAGLPGEYRGAPDPYAGPGLWIQCIEAPPSCPGRLGWAKPVPFLSPEDNPYDAGSRYAARHAEQYGGKWTVLTEHTWSDIQAAEGRLRAGKEQQDGKAD